MNRKFKGFIVMLLCLTMFMVGCSSKEQVVKYEGSAQDGSSSTVTYYAKGDIVTKQISESSYPFAALGVSNADEAKTILDTIPDSYADIDGVETSIEYTDEAVVETVTVDYTKVNLQDLAEIEGSNIEGDTSKKVSLKKSIELIEGQGFTKVEDK